MCDNMPWILRLSQLAWDCSCYFYRSMPVSTFCYQIRYIPTSIHTASTNPTLLRRLDGALALALAL